MVFFNLIIILFLVSVFIFPLLALGYNVALDFWRGAWPIALILGLLLLALDGFFFINHRLFYLLEREDWPALTQYLEDRIFRGGHYSSRLVPLLANTYLVLSDSPAVISLENKVGIAKPALVDDHALIFGVARILMRDYAGAAGFFAEHEGKVKGRSRDWLRWYYGFALLLDKRFSPAADRMAELAQTSAEGLLAGLSAFFLADILRAALPSRSLELMAAALDGRKRVREGLPNPAAWNREAEKQQNEIHVAILSRYIKEAGDWLYLKEQLV
jgi:hypothetical protein